MIVTKATSREWVGLAVLALPCILATMDLTVLNLAAPSLTEDLRPGTSQLLWIMDIYGFMIAAALIPMGTLGDRIGRRKLLLIGAAAFGVASVLAAFSKTAAMLIATRALLGVAGATLAPSTLSLIRNMFQDPRERTTAISVWVTCFSVGAMMGPLLGGILLEHFSWGSVFLLNVPVMVLLLVLGPMLLPEFRDPNAGRQDILSVAMSLSAVLSVIYGLKKIAEHGLDVPHVFAVAAGIMVGGLFVRRQGKLADPLIDLRLFRVPAFSAALSMNMLGCIIAFGSSLFVSQFLQMVLGFSPLKAGFWSLPSTAAFMLGTMITPALARRVRPENLIAGGLIVTSAGFVLLSRVNETSGMGLLVTALFIYSIGLAPIFTLCADLIVGSAPPEKAGAAASLNETSSEFGGAVGMAVLGSVGMAVYRIKVAAALPDGLPPESIEAARGTLGGALSVAKALPGELGAALLVPARMAFADALQLVAVVCAVIAIAMAMIAAVLFRRADSNRSPDNP